MISHLWSKVTVLTLINKNQLHLWQEEVETVNPLQNSTLGLHIPILVSHSLSTKQSFTTFRWFKASGDNCITGSVKSPRLTPESLEIVLTRATYP